jgi:hypothetical protein
VSKALKVEGSFFWKGSFISENTPDLFFGQSVGSHYIVIGGKLGKDMIRT